jgi:hypothetical protein
LAAALDECFQPLGLLIFEKTDRGLDGLAEAGQNLGVDTVSFGQTPEGLGKITGLTRIDDHHRKPRRCQCAH